MIKDLGVSLVGHRRKLLAAIAALRSESGPEPRVEARDVADTGARFDDFVVKYMGDGALVYFGYPAAHEDDDERAVRAGLAVIGGVDRLAMSTSLNVRLGIASGLVVVGDLIGVGAAGTRRDRRDAIPGGTAAGAGPARYARHRRQHGAAGTSDRGRGSSRPAERRGGIDKSRLVGALHDRLADQPHTRLRYFCSPHHQDSALYPFITQLERAAGFGREDTVETRLDKLEALRPLT